MAMLSPVSLQYLPRSSNLCRHTWIFICVGVWSFVHWSETPAILGWGDNVSVGVQVPCSFLLLFFVFVGHCILLIHLVVSVLVVILPIPTIPRTKSLALIMLARLGIHGGWRWCGGHLEQQGIPSVPQDFLMWSHIRVCGSVPQGVCVCHTFPCFTIEFGIHRGCFFCVCGFGSTPQGFISWHACRGITHIRLIPGKQVESRSILNHKDQSESESKRSIRSK